MKVPKLFVWVAIAVVAYMSIAVGLFAWNLRELPISSTGAQPWAYFGTYIGGVLGPAFALTNLVVIAYIAIRVNELQQTGLATKRLTLDLYRDWHSDELHQSRIKVTELIETLKKGQSQLPTLSEFEHAGTAVGIHTFRIYHFFERWAHLAHERQIDSLLLGNMLKTYAGWWNRELFIPLRSRETDEFMIGTLVLIEREVFSKIKPAITQDADAQPCGQPNLAHKAAQGRLP